MLKAPARYAPAARCALHSLPDVCGCGNTLECADDDAAPLLEGVTVVSSAMAELTRRQGAGAASIRP